MAESKPTTTQPATTDYTLPPTKWTTPWPFFAAVLAPVLAAMLVYQLDSFDPAPLPLHELTQPPLAAPRKNGRVLQGAEYVGAGNLLAPEDIAFDTGSGLIYTTCADGWIKRVTVNDSVTDSVVENWVHTGGRPLGLVLGHHGEVIVADAYKGLLRISDVGEVDVLTNEAEGLGFNFTDGVDIADDGTIYFTDASYKYDFHNFMGDILEGKPYGRFLSYDPITKQTTVLARDLYFPNGVAVSPDQDYVVFCETPMRRCRRYYIRGEKKGSIEKFVELPGLPDNIRYAEGHYWIAFSTVIYISI
ncbi:hypothetical protein Tsubulata_041453 [Turnera subulata]|uniref:Strictosidine synthase conserved region domain-containing protein n=1 Tax=Turnera subulata TaxID=218843 RepID=A0A9Q0JL69_9ROSI|nr:hypothetical protein Tsubulata_041453 [Turnera subulata]